MVLYIVNSLQEFEDILEKLNYGDTIRGIDYYIAISRLPDIDQYIKIKTGNYKKHIFVITPSHDFCLIDTRDMIFKKHHIKSLPCV